MQILIIFCRPIPLSRSRVTFLMQFTYVSCTLSSWSNFLSSFPHFFLFFLKKRESCTLVTSLLEVTRIHMKNRSVLKDGWEDVQGGATPKRYDLPQGNFLKFSLFPLFLVLLRLKQIFLCTGTNFRRYITSYEYPMDIFGYTKFLDMQNYIRKITWNYFLRGSVRFLFFSDHDRFFETQ